MVLKFELNPMEVENRTRTEKIKKNGLKRLKEIRNLTDLHILLRDLGKFDLYLYSKRKGHCAFNFSQAFNPNKTEYLYDDGISTGLSRFENLHRHLTIR